MQSCELSVKVFTRDGFNDRSYVIRWNAASSKLFRHSRDPPPTCHGMCDSLWRSMAFIVWQSLEAVVLASGLSAAD